MVSHELLINCLITSIYPTWQAGRSQAGPRPDFRQPCFWAIAVTAFFGFFRLGKLLVETESDYNPALHLSWGNVAIDAHSETSMVKIHLKKSKYDQFGKGADILLGHTVCPVAAILSFIGSRRDTAGCFFIDNEKKPITKSHFVSRVRNALSKAGYAEEQFAGHSFRIGAATSAALVGIEDSMIQALGRWHSAAYLRYIRTPHSHLAALTATLAKYRDPMLIGATRIISPVNN